ncbi:hypothetical protein FSOLCH5_011003 [Fusarium solani]
MSEQQATKEPETTTPQAQNEPLPGVLPAQHWAQIAQTQDPDDDADSAIEDNASSTASLSSSILQYRTIHGRTYHSDRGNAEYW